MCILTNWQEMELLMRYVYIALRSSLHFHWHLNNLTTFHFDPFLMWLVVNIIHNLNCWFPFFKLYVCLGACVCAHTHTHNHVTSLMEDQGLCGVCSLLLSLHGFQWLNSGHQTYAASGKWFFSLSHLSCPLSSSLYSLLNENYHFFSKLTKTSKTNYQEEKNVYVSSEAFLDSYGTSGLLEGRILNISLPLSKQLERRVGDWGLSHPYTGSFR